MPLKTIRPIFESSLMSQYSGESYTDQERRNKVLRSLVWGQDYRRLPFPVKLHKLLSWEPVSSDLWWTDGGKSFAVNRQGFKRHVMNVYFDERKFHSFQTLLHKYGFHSVESINNTVIDIIVYHHELFVQDNFELCNQITRTRKPNQSSGRVAAVTQRLQDKTTPSTPSNEKTMEVAGC